MNNVMMEVRKMVRLNHILHNFLLLRILLLLSDFICVISFSFSMLCIFIKRPIYFQLIEARISFIYFSCEYTIFVIYSILTEICTNLLYLLQGCVCFFCLFDLKARGQWKYSSFGVLCWLKKVDSWSFESIPLLLSSVVITLLDNLPIPLSLMPLSLL